jgi:hypothetical protein
MTPRQPHRMVGREQIGGFLHAVAALDIRLKVSDEVIGPDRMAFMVSGDWGDGRRIIENVIMHIENGQIARQVDVEAWD